VIIVGETSATDGVIKPGRGWAQASVLAAKKTTNSTNCLCIWFMTFSSETELRLEHLLYRTASFSSEITVDVYRGYSCP